VDSERIQEIYDGIDELVKDLMMARENEDNASKREYLNASWYALMAASSYAHQRYMKEKYNEGILGGK
jgi:hypothetical protein